MSGTTLFLDAKLLKDKSRISNFSIQGFHMMFPVYFSIFISCHSSPLYLDIMFVPHVESFCLTSTWQSFSLTLKCQHRCCFWGSDSYENLVSLHSSSAFLLNPVSGKVTGASALILLILQALAPHIKNARMMTVSWCLCPAFGVTISPTLFPQFFTYASIPASSHHTLIVLGMSIFLPGKQEWVVLWWILQRVLNIIIP